MSDEPIVPAGPPEPEEEASAERDIYLQARRDARATIPSIYIDDWATLTWKGHVRIVLGEVLYGKNNYRMAIVMGLDEAQMFAEELLERVTKRKEKDAAGTENDQNPESGL